MKKPFSRRHFIKTTATNALGMGLLPGMPIFGKDKMITEHGSDSKIYEGLHFIPVRVASWWCNLEDLLWPEKKIADKIKRRSEAFAKAGIDTAINFGFHIRFDFSNYFGQLHGYYASVCEELHKYNIRFLDHYSCNHVERPRGAGEFARLHRTQRHHILLFQDEIAAEHAQYEGHRFHDLCQVNLLDGSRGYAKQYQMEAFCHNNPGFLDMHRKYLLRLFNDVPMDGIQVDDMCDYAGPLTCGCIHCRERFRNEYGHEIPGFEDTGFWGETKGKNEFKWGNYESPAFRDWIRMRADIIADHLKMIKEVTGDKPLMTCCSASGPISLNALNLNLEQMAPYLDFFMLENCGINTNTVNWIRTDAEAMHQKDMALKKNAVPIALSYTIYEKGGYLGWCLSRFWGVANWSSTLNQRLEEDPPDAMEIEEIIGYYNNWELKNSNLDHWNGRDLIEVRLVNSRHCRENGWRGEDGMELWDKIIAWSGSLVRKNIGYRFVRCDELSDATALCTEKTPLILDSVGCISDNQFKAIQKYASAGGEIWLALPFGTHDEKGFRRSMPLSERLLKSRYSNLHIVESATSSDTLSNLISTGIFKPALKYISGDNRWVARVRFHEGKPVIHFMNSGLSPVPHPTIKDMSGVNILKDIESPAGDSILRMYIDTRKIPLCQFTLMSPELNGEQRMIEIMGSGKYGTEIKADLTGIKIYACATAV